LISHPPTRTQGFETTSNFIWIQPATLNDFASFCNIFGDVINGRDLQSSAMAGQNIRGFLLSLDNLK